MDSVNSIPMTQLVKEYQQNVWQKISVPRAFSSCRKDGALMGEPGVAKASLPTYNRKYDFKFYLGEFLFRASCEEKGIDTFNTFLELVRKIDWTNFTYAD
ncbi:hypothetical protein NPIL_504661 [Nephila pilipes]|uniref:Uncharacterized protein n=1 Tax=Nephila pilipes TaxID=299642 RepID=A0A8X6P9H3_NEPPI|nr:hypothetical protein NPIL_504661 [Nephila pilipes]